jgi:hypothetical protein
MRLFFDNSCGESPSKKTTHYVGEIVKVNSIAGDENYIRIVMTDQIVIDFFKSWVEEISKSPVDVNIKKTIFLIDDANSIASISSCIKDFKRDCGWWNSKSIEGAYEVKIIPNYIDEISIFDKELFKSIMIMDIRDKRINKILDEYKD